jgi:signal transduction histidine kinase/CheY-like chemotaxis protein
VLPVLFEGDVKAAIELASFGQFSDVHLAFLDQLTQSIGIVLNTIAATMRTEQLLKQSQALAEELQSQQLQLQTTNEELQEKAQLLAEQKTEVETKNQEVEQAKKALEEKAEQLALTSKYKSEFLANMSHELRTPLNNLLILARMLSENSDKNLTPKQVKFAETIHTSGTDLLALISDILDLSKIESGKMDVDIGGVRFMELQDYCEKTFRHVAEGKNLDFGIELGSSLLNEVMHTDAKRLQQVLKNLLSNALKFTERGSVRLSIDKVPSGWSAGHMILSRAKSAIAFSVTDTGIGIQTDKQRIIFEAFQQADGTTSRKYGGTGLGLSISRELARLLGGEIRLQSAPGIGSTFTLYLPQTYLTPVQMPKSEALRITPIMMEEAATPSENVDMILTSPLDSQELVEDLVLDDDRNMIQPNDAVLLIVEDDITFARILVDLAHDHALKALVALRGSSAISLAREFRPGAITLDIGLPDMAGWTILDRLKHDPNTRHIPVHIISGDENRKRGIGLGAITYLEKALGNDSLGDTFAAIGQSTKTRVKKLLLVCTDQARKEGVIQTLAAPDLEIIEASSGSEALQVAGRETLDGIVIHLELEDMPALGLAARLQSRGGSGTTPPILILTTRAFSSQEERNLAGLSRASIVKPVYSLERLLDDSVLLLHRAEANLRENQRTILDQVRQTDTALFGKTVLVVDDDVRNIFALTSLLEEHNLNVVHAENGHAGIELLTSAPGIDLVLMDIMMPEMDGYETMRAIRKIPRFRSLPIIALTAKAMKGDRAKCIEAGASDYITKPVDLEQLFSVLRVWVSGDHEIAQIAVQV